jgi:hypothetical protein
MAEPRSHEVLDEDIRLNSADDGAEMAELRSLLLRPVEG